MAGSLGEADTSRNHGFEYFVLEKVLEILRNLASEVGAIVEHGKQYAFGAEIVLEGFANAVNCVHQLGYAFQGEELALDGYENGIGSQQGIDGKQIQCRGAIEDQVVVLFFDAREGRSQNGFPVFQAQQFDIRPNEVPIRPKNVQPFALCGRNGFLRWGRSAQYLVQAG